VSMLLLGLERCSSIFRNLCRGILYNLCRGILHNLRRRIGPDLCLLIFPGRPRLELPKQAFTIFRWVSDRWVQRKRHFRRGPPLPLAPSAKPEHWR
jgi:hypothetical protein